MRTYRLPTKGDENLPISKRVCRYKERDEDDWTEGVFRRMTGINAWPYEVGTGGRYLYCELIVEDSDSTELSSSPITPQQIVIRELRSAELGLAVESNSQKVQGAWAKVVYCIGVLEGLEAYGRTSC